MKTMIGGLDVRRLGPTGQEALKALMVRAPWLALGLETLAETVRETVLDARAAGLSSDAIREETLGIVQDASSQLSDAILGGPLAEGLSHRTAMYALVKALVDQAIEDVATSNFKGGVR